MNRDRRCTWVNGCNEPVQALGHCRRHYGTLRRAGRLPSGHIDPGPARARIAEHLRRGRTIRNLAVATGIDDQALRRILDGVTQQVRITTQARIFTVELPPTEIGTRRRLHAMARLGWSVRAFAEAAGISRGTLSTALLRGNITPDLANRVADAYEKLSNTPGPSWRVTEQATELGYPSPMAWDDIDIDDPRAQPNIGAPNTKTAEPDEVDVLRIMRGEARLTTNLRAARDEAIRRLTRAGRSAEWIAQQIGCSPRTVIRVRNPRPEPELAAA